MNILIVSQYFWPETFRINDLAFSLVEQGHKVTVLAGTPNYPKGSFFDGYGWLKKNRENIKGVEVIRVPIIPRGKTNKFFLLMNYISYALTGSIAALFISKRKYDLIFVFQMSPVTLAIPALVVKKIKKIPIFLWVQDLWPESISAVGIVKPNSPILKPIQKLVKYIYSKCDRILIQSRAFEKSIRQYINKTEPLYYFPNFAEKLYQPIPLNKNSPEYQKMPTGFRIMFAGNIGVAQDFDTILKAADILREYRDIQWVILGDGRAKPWVEERIKELGLSNIFHLLGKHPVEKMPIYFSFADILLVTLKKDPIFALTIPAKLQSYLACAKPIVAGLDGEGGSILAESNAGISCPSEDPQSIAAAVLKIYNMPQEQRLQMGISGKEYFDKNFELKGLISKLEDWMQSTINSNKN